MSKDKKLIFNVKATYLRNSFHQECLRDLSCRSFPLVLRIRENENMVCALKSQSPWGLERLIGH